MTTTTERPAAPERGCCPQLHVINDLSYQVAGHQRRLALRSDNVADVKDVVEATSLQVINVAGELANVGERVGRLETAQGETNKRLGRLEIAQDATNLRLDQMDGRLDRMDGRLDQMDGRLGLVEGRLNHLEAGQIRNRELLSEILAAVEGKKGRKKG